MNDDLTLASGKDPEVRQIPSDMTPGSDHLSPLQLQLRRGNSKRSSSVFHGGIRYTREPVEEIEMLYRDVGETEDANKDKKG